MAFLSWGVLGTKGYKRVGSHRISSFSSSSSPSFPSSFFLFLPSYSFTSSTSFSLKELNLRSFLTTNITHPLSYSVQYRRGGKDLWRSCCRMRRKMRRERRERRRQKTKKRAVVNLLVSLLHSSSSFSPSTSSSSASYCPFYSSSSTSYSSTSFPRGMNLLVF